MPVVAVSLKKKVNRSSVELRARKMINVVSPSGSGELTVSLSITRNLLAICVFFSSRRRHTRYGRDWSSDVCSSDLERTEDDAGGAELQRDADVLTHAF